VANAAAGASVEKFPTASGKLAGVIA
jgi:hypothetical protein